MKLHDCTSGLCKDYNCKHCPECSHAIYRGWGKDSNGKWHRWTFRPYYGFTFIDKKGEALADQPEEKDPAWDPAERWLKRLNKCQQ